MEHKRTYSGGVYMLVKRIYRMQERDSDHLGGSWSEGSIYNETQS
jgi:hypothetical protein